MRRPLNSLLLLLVLLAPLQSWTAHTSNWAVLVSTSRFWFNYRHMANALSIYRTVKRLGIPDSQIILMLPDDMACNPRNAFPGKVFNDASRAIDLYGSNIEVDYRGYEVTVEMFIRLLTDRLGEDVPASKRLGSDKGSNVLIYLTGHGGDEFLKFQDAEEIGGWDVADALAQMWTMGRYNELLFMVDTCQANTLYSRMYSPNIIATGSSALGQSSYSHHADNDVGVAVIDRWTYYVLDFLENAVEGPQSNKTLGDLFDSYDAEKVHSEPGIRWDLFGGGEEEGRRRRIIDFFGNSRAVEVMSKDDPSMQEDILGLIKLMEKHEDKEEKERRRKLLWGDEDRFDVQGPPIASRSRDELGEPYEINPKNVSWSQTLGGPLILVACAAAWWLAEKAD